MKLSVFILRDMEGILRAWEAFAAEQLPAADTMSAPQLRDHEQQILEAVAKDMESYQSRREQAEKSKGLAVRSLSAPETAAETHALLRARAGFDIKQMVAEYRALRANVLARWMASTEPTRADFDDMVRFNEAIDQALAESVSFFHDQAAESRNLLLGVLGHDLRNPLSVVQTTAALLSRINAGEQVDMAAGRIGRSCDRMKALLDDLVDFNRSTLGLAMEIRPRRLDLNALLADEIAHFQVLHGSGRLMLDAEPGLHGEWDLRRLQQLLGNLLTNALKYGNPDSPVRLTASSAGGQVLIAVHNEGPAIDPALLDLIFEPLRRGSLNDRDAPGPSMGLGLFIARAVAKAHGGDVDVRSADDGTVFWVRLPVERSAVLGG